MSKWFALLIAPPLFTDAMVVIPNFLLGSMVTVAVCWLRWRSPWARR